MQHLSPERENVSFGLDCVGLIVCGLHALLLQPYEDSNEFFIAFMQPILNRDEFHKCTENAELIT